MHLLWQHAFALSPPARSLGLASHAALPEKSEVFLAKN